MRVAYFYLMGDRPGQVDMAAPAHAARLRRRSDSPSDGVPTSVRTTPQVTRTVQKPPGGRWSRTVAQHLNGHPDQTVIWP